MIAVEQQLIDGVADPAGRRLDQRELHVARRVVDAEEVARQPALRRRDDDAARMRELLRLVVPREVEARRVGQRLDRRLVAGQEVPAAADSGRL